MKKVFKPFTIEAWKDGAEVETKAGHPVRILCSNMQTDDEDKFVVVGMWKTQRGRECVDYWDREGHYWDAAMADSYDLVIVEEVGEPERWADNREAIVKGWFIDNLSDYINVSEGRNLPHNYNVFATKRQAKSARAMARISQLMANDERYGGVVTDEEWEKESVCKSVIRRCADRVERFITYTAYYFLAFHSWEQRDLFLAENEQLVKEFFLID